MEDLESQVPNAEVPSSEYRPPHELKNSFTTQSQISRQLRRQLTGPRDTNRAGRCHNGSSGDECVDTDRTLQPWFNGGTSGKAKQSQYADESWKLGIDPDVSR